jgi:site-specific DNA-methyltransferase (adenine-specific)
MSREPVSISHLGFDYKSSQLDTCLLVRADCLEWLGRVPENALHAIVTDPPYGVKEYDFDQLEKRANGNGGVWRIPPSFDGHVRSPLPRFTALDADDRKRVSRFFSEWSRAACRALRPGGHVFVANNAFLAPLVYSALAEGGLEFRGQIIRLVRTLRGGDRPKNAEEEFSGVSSLPRGCYEPWGLFRKPMLPKMKVSDCLREYQTGGLRRTFNDLPLSDAIACGRTSSRERKIADHPSLKPQAFLRQIVWAALPLGVGIIADPFAGSGSTLAAAVAIGYEAVGVERFEGYYRMAQRAIPQLAKFKPDENEAMAVTIQDLQPLLFG